MQANDYLYTYGVKNQQYDYIPMSPYDGNIPPDAPQLSPSQSQHPGGYSSHHQYHPTPFDGTPGYGYFSPNAPMQPPPAAPGQLQSFHAHQPSDPTVYSMNQNFQFPQEPMRRGKSASGSSPKKSMKHMTCWYWHKYRECKYEEPQCLYAHSYAGTIRVADEPIQREPGKPAVAGKNALLEHPEYTDWTGNRGFITPGYRRRNALISPEVQQDIINIHAKHLLHDGKAGPQTIPPWQLRGEHQGEAGKTITEIQGPYEDITSLPPPKGIKRGSNAPPAAHDAPTASEEDKAENELLRKTVQTLTQTFSNLLSGRIAALRRQNEGCRVLFEEILHKLPEQYHDQLFKPLAGITGGMNKLADVESEARTAVENVRKELVEAGLGGLLTVLDRDFCAVTAGPDGGEKEVTLSSLEHKERGGHEGS